MNMFKKNGGFTLVELIVVIAILAILAGIAVPAYSGYIAKAQATADTTLCAAIKTAAQGALATKGEVTKIVVTDAATDKVEVTYKSGNTSSTVTITDTTTTPAVVGSADFAIFFTDDIVLKTGNVATWENGEWKITGTPYTPSNG